MLYTILRFSNMGDKGIGSIPILLSRKGHIMDAVLKEVRTQTSLSQVADVLSRADLGPVELDEVINIVAREKNYNRTKLQAETVIRSII